MGSPGAVAFLTILLAETPLLSAWGQVAPEPDPVPAPGPAGLPPVLGQIVDADGDPGGSDRRPEAGAPVGEPG